MMITILKNRTIKFAISCFDLVVEIIYKIITNQRTLIANGFSLVNRIAFCCVSFSCYIIHKINQYYNQYYQPGKERITGLHYIDEWIKKYLIWIFIPVVTLAKVYIDLNHMQNTQVIVVYQMLGYSYWLSWFLLMYVGLSCVESIIDALFNWYNTLNGQKAEQAGKKWVADGSKMLTKFQNTIGYLNSAIEGVFNILLVFLGIAYGSLWMKCAVACLLFASTTTSVIVKRRVWLMMQKKNSDLEKPSSYFQQGFYLLMLTAIILTPAVQFGIILSNINIFFGVAESSFITMGIALGIVSTFIIQRFILKGDQFCKYLFGIDYDTKGFDLFGIRFGGKPTAASSEEIGEKKMKSSVSFAMNDATTPKRPEKEPSNNGLNIVGGK